MTETNRYALIQRLLHWLIALLVLGTLGVGMILGFLGFEGTQETFGKTVTNALYTGHKTFGIMILALMLLRLGFRLALGAPPYQPPLTGFERVASRAVHDLLYMVLLAQPVLGWLATAAGGYPVQFFAWNLPGLTGKNQALSEMLFSLHEMAGWVIAGLLVLHIGGAMQHWLIKRDSVMTRMSLFN
ncbi:MAG: cytochrome b [Candidatus Competibacteraceae bacterium]|nr:cytochrome b [Candidatus Competibacteraceae bacterium]MCP5134368.1 cytochrome b [Gammaproteobacteria bacterium]